MATQEQIDQIVQALKPKNTGAHWGKVGKRPAQKNRIEVKHFYELGRIDDYDTEITADETWLVASGAANFPRMTPKMVFRIDVAVLGPTRLAVSILRTGPKMFRQHMWAPCQAVLQPRAFEGKNFKFGQMPRRDGIPTVLKETVQTRQCRQNGARWIEIDRPLDSVGPDMVAAFGDNRFGR